MDQNRLDEILELSYEDRLVLVQIIWDSLASESESAALSDEHAAELDRRIAAYRANPGDVRSWDEVEERVLSRLRKP